MMRPPTTRFRHLRGVRLMFGLVVVAAACSSSSPDDADSASDSGDGLGGHGGTSTSGGATGAAGGGPSGGTTTGGTGGSAGEGGGEAGASGAPNTSDGGDAPTAGGSGGGGSIEPLGVLDLSGLDPARLGYPAVEGVDAARARAEGIVAEFDTDEMLALVSGTYGTYIGNLSAAQRRSLRRTS